jgi:outer membrane lipase/esterase
MVRKLLATTALAAVATLVGLSASAQQRFSQHIVFGDSLSAVSNIPLAQQAPTPPYTAGRWSNGGVWHEYWQLITGTPTNSLAIGGARSGRVLADRDLQIQIDRHLAANPALSRTALYTVWIGGNDYLNLGTTDPAVGVATTITNTATGIARLAGAGARNIMVVNLPNLGDTPNGRAGGAAGVAAANQLTGLHNSSLQTAVAGLRGTTGANIYLVDVSALFSAVLASPGTYGFSNTTTPCFTGVAFTGACATAAGAATSLFFDPIHPTTANHQVVGQFVNGTLATLIDGASSLAPATQLAFRVSDLMTQGISSRLAGARAGGGSVNLLGGTQAGKDGKVGIYAFGGYATGDRDATGGQFGFDYDLFSTGVGVDYRVDDHVTVGAAFAYGKGNAPTENLESEFKVKSYGLTTYGTAAFGNAYVDGYFSYSFDGYKDSYRQTRFAPQPLALVDTDGDTYGGGVTAGYSFSGSGVSFGPEFALRYLQTEIDGYTEKNAGPLALTVDRMDAESLVGSIGARVSGKSGSDGMVFAPHLRVAYEAELMNADRRVSGRLIGGERTTSIVGRDDGGSWLVGAGLALESGSLTAAVGYEGRLGGDDGRDHAVTARVRFGF